MGKLSIFRALRSSISMVPRTVLYVGIYSMILNLSSAIVYVNLGLLLERNIGVTCTKLGIFESVVTFFGYTARLICGWLSDHIRNRKMMIIIGCLAIMSSNILFSYATTLVIALIVRCFGRLGHGVQSVSRAILVNDVTDTSNKGLAYGLYRSLGVLGSLCGAIGTYIFIAKYMQNITVQSLVLAMSVPPLIAAIFVAIKIQEPKTSSDYRISSADNKVKTKSNLFGGIYKLGRTFWLFMFISILFSSVYVSDVIVITSAVKKYSRPDNAVNLMAIIINASSFIAAYLCGYISDRIGKYRVFLIVFLLKCISYFWIGSDVSYLSFLCALFIMGIPMIALQNIPESIIADIAPKDHSGIAFGIYYFAIALSTFFASVVFGRLVDAYSLVGAMRILSYFGFAILLILIVFEMLGFLRNNGVRE